MKTRTFITVEEAEARERATTLGQIEPWSLQGQPIPERRWLVPNLIPRGAVTMLSGDGGVGKSLLAMQLMTAGALGHKWIGIEVAKFSSLGFFCEDDGHELHRRQGAINRHFGCDFEHLRGMVWWPRVGRENVLVQYSRDSGAPPRLSRQWSELEATVRARAIELIVIDTAADVFGGNENYRSEVRAFIARLRDLARINDGAVLLMAHPSVAGQQNGSGISGSTAWNNSVRSRLYFTRPRHQPDDEGDARELKGMKSNYDTSGGKIKLRYEAGVFVRDESGTGMVAAIEARNLAKKFAELVAIAQARGMPMSPNKSISYAPAVLADLPEANGVHRKVLAKGMHAALKEGYVLSIQHGPPSKRTRLLIVNEAMQP